MADQDVTSLQKRMLVNTLENHQPLTQYSVPFHEAIGYLKRLKKLLDTFGPTHSEEFWCRYWNQWQLHVKEKGIENLDNFDDLERRVWFLVDKTNREVYNPYPIKDSPLMKLRQDLLHFHLEKAMIVEGYRVYNIFEHPELIIDGAAREVEVPQEQVEVEIINEAVAQEVQVPSVQDGIEVIELDVNSSEFEGGAGFVEIDESLAAQDTWLTIDDLIAAFSS